MARLALILAALLLLTGCGGGDDGGDTVSGNGYEVTVPDGWDDESERGEDVEVAGFSPELVLAGEREDGFTTNVNVVRNESAGVDIDEQTEGERRVLQTGDLNGTSLQAASELSPVERTTLDGEEARAYEFELSASGKETRARQVIALQDGQVYAITFTTLRDRFDDEVDAFEEILDSWRWR